MTNEAKPLAAPIFMISANDVAMMGGDERVLALMREAEQQHRRAYADAKKNK